MITVSKDKLRKVLDRCEMVSTEGSHTESCMAIAEAFKELRSMLEQKPSEPTHFICHGHLYTWPSEDNFCGNPEDHILLYAKPPFNPDWATYRQGVEDGKAEAMESDYKAMYLKVRDELAALQQEQQTMKVKL